MPRAGSIIIIVFMGASATDLQVMFMSCIIESVDFIESIDSISRDEQDVPLTQYITNA